MHQWAEGHGVEQVAAVQAHHVAAVGVEDVVGVDRQLAGAEHLLDHPQHPDVHAVGAVLVADDVGIQLLDQGPGDQNRQARVGRQHHKLQAHAVEQRTRLCAGLWDHGVGELTTSKEVLFVRFSPQSSLPTDAKKAIFPARGCQLRTPLLVKWKSGMNTEGTSRAKMTATFTGKLSAGPYFLGAKMAGIGYRARRPTGDKHRWFLFSWS